MKTIDLHVHSCISDGTLTPEELVRLAVRTGLSAFALTDHDSTDGIDRAARAAADTGVQVVPGIEFSTRWQHKDIHILGYLMDYHAPSFQERLHEFVNSRNIRNEKMCRRIREYTGFPVYLNELTQYFPDAVVTRAHMATWLMEQGYVETRAIAFDKYLGDHAPCFIPKEEITPQGAVRLILAHGGVPVLAHPLLYALSDEQAEQLVIELKEAGLKGLEAIYVMNKGADEQRMRALAKKHGLLITGGSDFHGANKPGIFMGTGLAGGPQALSIPASLLAGLINSCPVS